MAGGIELAKAYVQIVPSAKGFGSKLESEMQSAGSKSAGKFSLGFGKAASAITTVTAAGLAAATAAVADLTAKALEAGAAFETAFAQVQTIMDTTAMSVEDMSSGILNLSNEMGVSTDELSNTVYNVISATGDTANALEIAASAAKLATAGFTDSGSSLSVLTTAMNAYGLAAEDVEHISDSLIMVQNLGVTTVADLSASMGKAIASASAYGVDLENVEAAYVSMTKAGINTAESTTYMSSMMKELGDSGTAAAKLLKDKTGKSFAELMGDGNSLADVLNILYEAEGSNATALMNLWSSAEAGKAANAMLSQGFETFNENLGQIKTTAGVTQTAFETMENTMSSKMDHMKNSWTNLLAGMTMENVDFSGLIDGFVEDFGNVVNMLAPKIPIVLNGVVQLITTMIPQLIELLGPVFSENLPILLTSILSVFSSLIQMLATELPNIMGAILDMLPLIIASVSTALIENLPILIAGLVDLVAKIVEKLPEILSAIWDAIVLVWDTWIGPAMDNVGQFFTDLWDSIKEIFSVVGEWFDENVIQPVVGFFKGLWEDVSGFFSDLWDDIVGIWTSVSTWFDENVIQPVVGFFKGVWDDVSGFFKNLWDDIVDAYHTVIDPWLEIFKRAGAWVDENIITPVKNFFSDLWEDIKAIWTKVSRWFDDNVIQPVKGFFEDVWNSISGFASDAWDTIKGVWDVVSGWFEENITEPIGNFFSDIWDKIKNGASDAWEGIKEVFSVVSNWFKDKFETAWEGVKNVFSTGGQIFENIQDGISSVFKTVVNAIIRGINTVVAGPFNTINWVLRKLKEVSILGVSPFGWISELTVPQIPEILAQGGVLERGQVGLLEGSGAEAVVPLEHNTKWIRAVAEEMDHQEGDDDLVDLVEELTRKIDRMRIVLDTGKLVGGISTKMDGALGTNANYQERGVALA